MAERAAFDGWIRTAKHLPPAGGKYLCAVYLKPRIGQGAKPKGRPARFLHRVLTFDPKAGGFWLDNGMPGPGVVTHWTSCPTLPPKDEMRGTNSEYSQVHGQEKP